MPTPMTEWLAKAVEKYENYPQARMAGVEFHRDPTRAQHVDSAKFFSPADGVIISQSRVAPEGDVIETKGTKITLSDLMKPWPIDVPCLNIGIFLTYYDVHRIRMPTAGVLTNQYVDPIRTCNLPMLWEEKSIVKKGVVSKIDMRYMASNGRVLCKISQPHYTYYMVLLADSDIDRILLYNHRKHAPMMQCQRSHYVTYGSQCNLILPLDDRYKFKTICRVTDHVEAATDALVSVEIR